MTTYSVSISPDKKAVRIRIPGATQVPFGYITVGTYDHDPVTDPEDPLELHGAGHTHFHHVQEILGRRSFANPAVAATFPDNIIDMAALQIFKNWEAPPVVSALPTLTGTARVGFVLTLSQGTWSEGGFPTLTRAWYANGVLIPGATASTYTPVVGDLGKTITAKLTGTNAFGSTEYLIGPTAAVIAA